MKFILVCSFWVLAWCASAQSTDPTPYCNAGFDEGGFGDVPDAIDLVSFGSLYNESDSQYAYPHYVYYSNLAAPTLNAGSTYALKVRFAPQGAAGYGVWIDYNHNDVFDSVERVSGTSGSTYLQLTSDSILVNITIPANAVVGPTRMRVRIVEDDNYHALHGSKELACNLDTTAANTMDWGETEDYNLMIAYAAGISGIEAAAAASLYPNPATDILTLKTQNYEEGNAYAITNAIGQTMSEGKVTGPEQAINVSSLSTGIYLLRVYDRSHQVTDLLKLDKQ